MNNQIFTVELNRKNLFLNIMLLLMATIFSFFMVSNPENFVSIFFRNKELVFIVSILGFICFLIILISRCIHFCNNKSAFIITNAFIVDNSTYESFGKINWDNIQSVETKVTLGGNKYIEIRVKKGFTFSETYERNFLKKILIFMKNWNYKSSFILTNKFLKISFDDFESLISKNFEEYKMR